MSKMSQLHADLCETLGANGVDELNNMSVEDAIERVKIAAEAMGMSTDGA